MTRCRAIFDPIFAEHDHPGHPENKTRLADVSSWIPGDVSRLGFRPALPGDVERVHDPSYLARLEQRCASTSTVSWLDPDTYITRRSYEVALHAAGAAIAAVEISLKGEHCFALVRPPGHHAEYDRAMGFCLINNVAVAARKALLHAGRIAIVDWDVHHGNGTQHSFYGTDRVLYCSVHQEHQFPYSGSARESGAGDGKGYTVNAPLPAGSAIGDYYHVFSEIFVPLIERFSPDALIVSAGQDILFDDPLGAMRIYPQDFGILTRMLVKAAGVPLALVLEGGYGPSHGVAVRHIFTTLTTDGEVREPAPPSEQARRVVSYLKEEHPLCPEHLR
jgi:acetoin utilization deacetylase AcuC-like enzyme